MRSVYSDSRTMVNTGLKKMVIRRSAGSIKSKVFTATMTGVKREARTGSHCLGIEKIGVSRRPMISAMEIIYGEGIDTMSLIARRPNEEMVEVYYLIFSLVYSAHLKDFPSSDSFEVLFFLKTVCFLQGRPCLLYWSYYSK